MEGEATMSNVLTAISAADVLALEYQRAGNLAAAGPLLAMAARWKAWVKENMAKTVPCRESIMGCRAVDAQSNVTKARADFEAARKAAAAFGPPPPTGKPGSAFLLFGLAALGGYLLWKWGQNEYSKPPGYAMRSY